MVRLPQKRILQKSNPVLRMAIELGQPESALAIDGAAMAAGGQEAKRKEPESARRRGAPATRGGLAGTGERA
jgi:hypothetical protein